MLKRLFFILSFLVLVIELSFAQSFTANGIVVDDEGEGVIGATVVLKGTTNGVVTDIDGLFSINVPESGVLVFSQIGSKTVEQKAAKDMRVVLSTDSKMLDDIVVVAYGTATKASFTGSAAKLSADKILSGSKEALDKALVGKVAGVRVSSNTGDPGAAGDISIRGISTINGSTQPLYVIDGIPFDAGNDVGSGLKSMSALSTINPSEIESMTILKDAAASSLYGSRAVNGVVIITTKKGRAGKTSVSYNGEYGITKMAVKQFEMADATSTIDYYREGVANYYLQYGYAADKQAAYDLVASENDMAGFFADPTGKTNTNWWDEVYKNGNTQNHQVSVTAGNDKTKIFTGIGYNRTEGIVHGSSFDRYSGRVNVDHEINKIFSISARQSISSLQQEGFRDQHDQKQGIGTSSPVGILFAMDPTATVYDKNGEINANAGWGKVSNPLLMLGSSDEFVKSKIFRSISNVDLTAKIIPDLTFKTSWAYDYMNAQHHEFWSPTSVNGQSLNGMGFKATMTKWTLTTSSTLNYLKTFNEHSLNILVGFETAKSNLDQLTGSAKDYTTGKLPELSVGQPYRVGSSVYKSALMSYLGQASYNYAEKYYATASFRSDGSSFLGKDNRWGNFYSASLAWRAKQESFLIDNEVIADLKFRASMGTTGNLPSTYYANLALYSFTGGYGNQGAIYWGQIGNSKLGWERTTSYNVGFDVNFLSRIGLTVEYFEKRTSDLLLNVPTSLSTGFQNVLSNAGKMYNRGVEIEINSQNIITKNFTWTSNFNITFMKNRITSLPNGDIPFGDGEMYIQREGESINSFYLPVWAGVNSETGLGQFWIDPNDHSKGLTNYYTQAGKTVVGKPTPDAIGGFSNTFTFKDFDFTTLITFQYGGSLFDYPGYFANSDGVRIGSFGILKTTENNYWKNPGDQVENPKPIYANKYRSDRWSTRHILSTDNIRLRELTFGYNIPVKKFEFLKGTISSARIYFSANNIAMIWAKEKNIDPDVSLMGYRQVDTPVTKSYMFGLNVNF